MNRYRHRFTALCPNNGKTIRYRLALWTEETIMVEDIIDTCKVESAYHEDLAQTLFLRFGGRQVLRAFHHGVEIKTVRGEI